MGIWQLGNTTVRSAMRIRDGLVALLKSDLQGDIRKKRDRAFRQLLGDCGVVTLGNDRDESADRKWRNEKRFFLLKYAMV